MGGHSLYTVYFWIGGTGSLLDMYGLTLTEREEREKESEREETDRQTDRQTDRRTDGQTDRQTD